MNRYVNFMVPHENEWSRIDQWPYEPAIAKRGNLLWLGEPVQLYRVFRVEHCRYFTNCFLQPEVDT